jgi:hypothetical protein
VAVNLGEDAVVWEVPEGRVVIGTDRSRDGEPVPGHTRLGGWEGLVVELAPTG